MSELQAALARRRSINGEEAISASASASASASLEGPVLGLGLGKGRAQTGKKRAVVPPPAAVEPGIQESDQDKEGPAGAGAGAAVAVEGSGGASVAPGNDLPGLDISALTQDPEDKEENEEEDVDEDEGERVEDSSGTASPIQMASTSQPCAETETDSEEKGEGEGKGKGIGIDKEKEVIILSIPDQQRLGVVVAPLNIEAHFSCGGLYVLEVPDPVKNVAGLHVHDVLIAVNGTDLTTMSRGSAAEFLRRATARTLTVVRRPTRAPRVQVPTIEVGVADNGASSVGAGLWGVEEEEGKGGKTNENTCNNKNSSRLSKRPFLSADDEGDKDGDRNTTSSPWKALKKRLVTRSSSRPLYAAGHEVLVDKTRVTNPTMIDEISLYPVSGRGSGSVFGKAVGADPYVDTLKNMTRRARTSAVEMQWPGR